MESMLLGEVPLFQRAYSEQRTPQEILANAIHISEVQLFNAAKSRFLHT